MDVQNILVYVIVAACAVYVAVRVFRNFKRSGSGKGKCGNGCGGCCGCS